MSSSTNASTRLDNPPVPVQVKLAAAWTSFMFLYVYVDVFNFFKPGVITEILNGQIFTFQISAMLLTVFLASVSIPAVMITLCVALPTRVNRVVNLAVALIYIPYSLFNAAGVGVEWAGFYGLSIGIEVLLLAFILRAAWAWPRARVVAPPAEAALRA